MKVYQENWINVEDNEGRNKKKNHIFAFDFHTRLTAL